jgi:hypothetical protein
VVEDYDAIVQTVQLCLDGEARGDLDKLREAFHEDARMFGSLAGERYDVPISTLMDMSAEAPADTGRYRSRILSIHQTGDAALARVAEEGYWGTVSFSTTSRWRGSTAAGRSSASCSPTPQETHPSSIRRPCQAPVASAACLRTTAAACCALHWVSKAAPEVATLSLARTARHRHFDPVSS